MSQSNGHFAVARAQQDEDADSPSTSPAPEYSFDGYTIDVSEKIALTPIAKHRHQYGPRGANGANGAHRTYETRAVQ
jgi:hypothetical protein